MPAKDVRVVTLRSVVLTREKRALVAAELDKYATATNHVIRTIVKQRDIISSVKAIKASEEKIIESLKTSFFSEIDPREHYLRDVVRTAIRTIAEHRRKTRGVAGARNRPPLFNHGRLVFSPPLVRVTRMALVLYLGHENELSIPFEKTSRSRESALLESIATETRSGPRMGRVRLTWAKEGRFRIDIRLAAPAD
ncbi:MAG: hypothetical protein HXY34_01650 [Candidatus Thorarchaeota archaeon]|nr:hypothetical protein [Candidatus Thorarchaeota archaeon]